MELGRAKKQLWVVPGGKDLMLLKKFGRDVPALTRLDPMMGWIMRDEQ